MTRAPFAAAAVVLAFAAGCPKEDGGVIVPPPPPMTSGTASGGSGGAVGTGGAGEGGFADDNCEVQPCKLVAPQCGCPIGRRCVDGVNGRYCTASGGKPAGALCDGDCIAGHVCTDNGTGAPRVCQRYCVEDADCPGAGGRCLLEIPDIDENLCTIDCDPVLQTGCVAAGSKCDVGYAAGGYSHCTGVGAGVQDALCTATADCAAGLTCTAINAGPLTCYTSCDVAAPVCPAATTCTAFTPAIVLDGTNYGICI